MTTATLLGGLGIQQLSTAIGGAILAVMRTITVRHYSEVAN
jgi:hypothetical protein